MGEWTSIRDNLEGVGLHKTSKRMKEQKYDYFITF